MALITYGTLHGRDLALETINTVVPAGSKRNLLLALLTSIEEFRSELPSILLGTFDLNYFSKVLIYSLENVLLAFNGRVEYWGVDRVAEPIEDIDEDVSVFGLRIRQANNFEARTADPQVKAVLQVLLSTSRKLQMEGRLNSSGLPMPSHVPAFPFDFLFMAMAVEQSLKIGRIARGLITTELGMEEWGPNGDSRAPG